MTINVPAELLVSMLLQEHELGVAPSMREYGVTCKEVEIAIGANHTATLTLDLMAIKELEKLTGIEIKEEAYEG